MDTHKLSPDTQAIVLLCSSLGKSRATEAPLKQLEYHQLAQLLHNHQMRPADLLQPNGLDRLQDIGGELRFDLERIKRLLDRGAALALAVESWTNKGLWLLSRSDTHYPQLIKTRLGREAPPIFYGVGNRDLLTYGGLAIVGSRNADQAAVDATQTIASLCAAQGIQVISGAARGVDSEAMQAALAAGGTVVGILADSLMKAAVAGKYRHALRDQTLVLLSAYSPDAGFSVASAMHRNKYIYTISDYALVISTSIEQGGTWAGAVENLTNGWVPLFVRMGTAVPEGNYQLAAMGAFTLDNDQITEQTQLGQWLAAQTQTLAAKHHIVGTPVPNEDKIKDLNDAPLSELQQTISQTPAAKNTIDKASPQEDNYIAPLDTNQIPNGTTAYATNHASENKLAEARQAPTESPHPNTDLFTIILPYLEQALSTPRTDREVATLLSIELKQAQTWLQRAVQTGHVKKLKKPVKYIAHIHIASLF